MANGKAALVIRGVSVSEDEHGNVCLNDMWALAGSPSNGRPADWHRGKRVSNLSGALAKSVAERRQCSLQDAAAAIHYATGKGRSGRTYAHAVLALDYAEYINPAIGVEVRTVFLRFKANDMALALEILENVTAQAEYDVERVKLRDMVIDHNKQSAGVAKDAGVKNFEAYNGAGLFGLYEMTKAQMLKHKGLPPDANHLDHANHEELAANYFKATQAAAKIKREGIKGQKPCEEAHAAVATITRNAIKAAGGVMPEDERALEHVKEARKRLKNATEPMPLPSMPPKKA